MLPRSLSELLKAEPENSSCQFMLVQRLWTKLLLTTLSGQFGFDRKMIWLSKNNVYFRNLDLYDVEKTVKEVVRQMEANPIISFPAECDFTLLNGFIREVAKGTVYHPFSSVSETGSKWTVQKRIRQGLNATKQWIKMPSTFAYHPIFVFCDCSKTI